MRPMLHFSGLIVWALAGTMAAAAATPMCPVVYRYVPSSVPDYAYGDDAPESCVAAEALPGLTQNAFLDSGCLPCGYDATPAGMMVLAPRLACERYGRIDTVASYERTAAPQKAGPGGRCEPVVPLAERTEAVPADRSMHGLPTGAPLPRIGVAPAPPRFQPIERSQPFLRSQPVDRSQPHESAPWGHV